jgi:prepilin-type processing-associated H-X9-DG protein/prepilin-type N-terminal cleavage/methylation domain-containing protein
MRLLGPWLADFGRFFFATGEFDLAGHESCYDDRRIAIVNGCIAPAKSLKRAERATGNGINVKRHILAPGFTLIEVLVVIGVLAVLTAILLPTLNHMRARARQSACSANLHRLGQAFAAYAADNRGWVPRNPAVGFKNHPVWPVSLARYIRRERLTSWADIATIQTYQCPSHPTAGIPSAFVINAFSFETRDKPTPWWGSPAVQASRIKSPATLPWLLETPDSFIELFPNTPLDQIFQESAHGIHKPEHLAGGTHARVSDTRHGKSSNVLYCDGHVASLLAGSHQLDDFDDGIRQRDWSRD